MDGTRYEMLEELALLALKLKSKISVNVLSNSHQDSAGGNDCRLHSKYVSVVQKLRAQFGDVFINPEPFLSVIKLGGLDVFGCRAMDIAMAIKPDGSVCLPCTRFSKKQLKGDLRKIFFGEGVEELRKLQGKDPNCEGCAMGCMSSASGLLTLKGQISTINRFARSII